MLRITIVDLPVLEDLTETEMKLITGGDDFDPLGGSGAGAAGGGGTLR
jgi:hypothetical protein